MKKSLSQKSSKNMLSQICRFILVFCVFVTGCDTDNTVVPNVTGQSTPQECLAKMYDAIQDDDFDKYNECYSFADSGTVKNSFIFECKSFSLANKVEKIFGEECWKVLKKIRIAQNYQTFSISKPYTKEEFLSTLEINGNKAVYYYPPYLYTKFGLVKKGDSWFYDHEVMPVNIAGQDIDYAINTTIQILDKHSLSLEEYIVFLNLAYYQADGDYDGFREALLEFHSEEMLAKLEAILKQYENSIQSETLN